MDEIAKNGVKRDPDYEWVAPVQNQSLPYPAGKGRQCGECGMTFDYNVSYGFRCWSHCCPMGLGPQ